MRYEEKSTDTRLPSGEGWGWVKREYKSMKFWRNKEIEK